MIAGKWESYEMEAQGPGHKAQGKQNYTVGADPSVCPWKRPEGKNSGQPQWIAPTIYFEQ